MNVEGMVIVVDVEQMCEIVKAGLDEHLLQQQYVGFRYNDYGSKTSIVKRVGVAHVERIEDEFRITLEAPEMLPEPDPPPPREKSE